VYFMAAPARLEWWLNTSFGPSRLAARAFNAGFSTLAGGSPTIDRSFTGFGERLAVRAMNVAASRGVEASLGAFWGENPRYFRKGSGAPAGARIWHAFYSSAYAPRDDGRYHFAWARLGGAVAGQYLSNPLRPSADRHWDQTLSRAGFSFGTRACGNLASEFLPDLKSLFRRSKPNQP
jgi:hypothetical protein